MTERKLKEFALIGLLVRINAEKQKLPKATKDRKLLIENRIKEMEKDYKVLLNELQHKNPQE